MVVAKVGVDAVGVAVGVAVHMTQEEGIVPPTTTEMIEVTGMTTESKRVCCIPWQQAASDVCSSV